MEAVRQKPSLPSWLTGIASRYFRAHAARLTAVAVLTVLYWQARIPASPDSLSEKSQRFSFQRSPLFSSLCRSLSPGIGIQTEEVEGRRYYVRAVHPSFHHIRSWIS